MSAPHRTHTHRSLSLSSLASTISHPPSKATLHSLIVPFLVLAGIVIASATQTEVAHSLTQDVGYNQPYFTFFLTHITFSLVFPVHLLFLLALRPRVPLRTYLDGIRDVIATQLDLPHSWSEVGRAWSLKMSWLTMLISIPALCWFVAMQYSPAMDITAIYATSSFHAYFFSMLLLKQPLSKVTGGSIALAFAGVIVLSLAGDESPTGSDEKRTEGGGGQRFLGDGIMMIGAVILGLYEVIYKLALPEGHGGVAGEESAILYDPLENDEGTQEAEEFGWEPPDSRPESPRPNADPLKTARVNIQLSPKSKQGKIDRKSSSTPLLNGDRPKSIPPPLGERNEASREEEDDDRHYHPHRARPSHPPLPAALHANFITSCIGLATLVLLWLPIPLIHYLGWEPFLLPSSTPRGSAIGMWASLGVIAWSGAAYNAGLMVLIGIWGPTTSSVANLLTIGLVAVIDAVLMGHLPGLQTMIGVGMICVGFGVLLWEGEG